MFYKHQRTTAFKRNTLNNKDYLQSKLRQIKIDSEGEKFRREREVKQGDPISPELLTYLMELIFSKMNWRNICGLNINGRKLTNLKFACDILLFAKSNEELQEMMNELTEVSTVAGLKINAKNTKVMENSAEIEIKLNGEALECVPECTYLGQLISFRDNMGKYIKTEFQWFGICLRVYYLYWTRNSRN